MKSSIVDESPVLSLGRPTRGELIAATRRKRTWSSATPQRVRPLQNIPETAGCYGRVAAIDTPREVTVMFGGGRG
jgi:hypothetical protein